MHNKIVSPFSFFLLKYRYYQKRLQFVIVIIVSQRCTGQLLNASQFQRLVSFSSMASWISLYSFLFGHLRFFGLSASWLLILHGNFNCSTLAASAAAACIFHWNLLIMAQQAPTPIWLNLPRDHNATS